MPRLWTNPDINSWCETEIFFMSRRELTHLYMRPGNTAESGSPITAQSLYITLSHCEALELRVETSTGNGALCLGYGLNYLPEIESTKQISF